MDDETRQFIERLQRSRFAGAMKSFYISPTQRVVCWWTGYRWAVLRFCRFDEE